MPHLHLFHPPLRGVTSTEQRHGAAPWTAWRSVIPTLMKATSSPGTDTLFAATSILRNHLLHVQTTLVRQMNSPVFLLKPLDGALRTHGTPKKH